jgi:uncharacterized protein
MKRTDTSRLILTAVIAAAILLLSLAGSLVGLYTDLLWFRELGQSAVLVRRVLSEIGVGLAFGVVAALFAAVNVAVARRLAPPPLAAVPMVEEWYRPIDQFVFQMRTAMEPVVRWVLVAAVLFIGWIEGASAAPEWARVWLYVSRVPFHLSDPLFSRDISTYVFSLPLWLFIQHWTLGLLALTGLLVLAVHTLDGAITPRALGERFAPHVKAHLSVLLALFSLALGWGYWLDRQLLLFSPRGQVTGAAYTDIHAQLPAYTLLVGISVVVAGLLFANIRSRGWRLPVIGVAIWLGSAILFGAVWPAIVQQLQVGPNEQVAERPYIGRNIEATRRAFGIADTAPKQFAANTSLTNADLVEDTATISNIRLWDPASIARTFAQLQEIRLYYQFLDVDVDRYMVNGQRRVVLLSARELDTSLLPALAQTWVNQHLVYTHGFGLVMSPASRVTPDGLPDFIIRDIPPVPSDPKLAVTRPGIYYGEVPDDGRYVVTHSGTKEFDYPQGTANQYSTYAGSGGIRLDSLAKRLAFALRFGDLQFLLAPSVNSRSRIMFRRNIVDRVRELAPFLTLDPDPYAVLVDGRVKWIQDAFTTSDYYPYSQRIDVGDKEVNYIRNSVKVVTDAYDGTVTFYVVDKADPVIAAWRKVFPTLFTDGASMPAALRQHLRYPELMFLVQANMLRAYHMLDIGAFYAKEDLWSIPADVTGAQSTDGSASSGTMAPYYVLMRLPGDTREHFMLMLPFTPNGKNNMIAWAGAMGDPDDYGKIVLFEFPKQRLIYGPSQIDAKINQDPQISAQLTLWNQQGSKVLRGNLLVIPVKQSIIYVQPIYLSAAQSQFPQLEKVVVAYGDRLVMENSIEAALTAIFGAAPPGGATAAPYAPGAAVPSRTPSTSGAPSLVPAPGVAALAREAQLHFDAAEAAARRGDWATYGKEQAALRSVLSRLAAQAATGR